MSIRSCRDSCIATKIGSERGKEARWYTETVGFRAARVAPAADAQRHPSTIRSRRWPRPTRATPISCMSISFRPSASRTSSPPCREIIPSARQELINLTLRYVEAIG